MSNPFGVSGTISESFHSRRLLLSRRNGPKTYVAFGGVPSAAGSSGLGFSSDFTLCERFFQDSETPVRLACPWRRGVGSAWAHCSETATRLRRVHQARRAPERRRPMTQTFFVRMALLLMVGVLAASARGQRPPPQPPGPPIRDAHPVGDDLGNRWRRSWRGLIDDRSWNDRDHRREWTVSDSWPLR